MQLGPSCPGPVFWAPASGWRADRAVSIGGGLGRVAGGSVTMPPADGGESVYWSATTHTVAPFTVHVTLLLIAVASN